MPSLDFSHAWPWLQWVLGGLAVVAFIAGALKTVPPAWRVLSRFVTTINSLGDLPAELEKQKRFRIATTNELTKQKRFRLSTTETLASQNREIATIKHQVLPNGGGSMRDDVTSIKEKLATDDERLKALEEKDEES